ncbi:serine protease 33-like [Rana temporaria]|uniref:serine protease 33-like n=1 Tax=Rana temporaria TaxID=8407 RepID=UPI001AAD5845|nr:serine protease 33-like [Rana temporaria]
MSGQQSFKQEHLLTWNIYIPTMQRGFLFVLLFLPGGHGGLIIEDRIVNGEDAKGAEWPWQVSLQNNGVHHCGGSLLTESWVLLVAHCFEDPLNVSQYKVYLGVLQLSNLSSPNIVERGVKKVIIHPDFVEEGAGGDIALIELDKPVSFTTSILPVCLLPQNVHLLEGTLCWATGWGDLSEGVRLPTPETLQMVEVALLTNNNCEAMYRARLGYEQKYKLIQEDMICAGYKQGGKDTCQGDSGGPLVCNVEGAWLQLGIISWGFGCARPSFPGVYTRVQYYQPWLLQYVPTVCYKEGRKPSPQFNATNPDPSQHSPTRNLTLQGLSDGKTENNSTFNATGIKMNALASDATSSHVFSMIGVILILLTLMIPA